MRTPILAILGLALWGSVSLGLAQDSGETCSSCHEQAKTIQGSPHADLGCASCHEKHEAYPHPTGVPKPECSACHADQAGEHAKSVHGQALRKGNAAAPTCSVCHGSAHEVKNTKSADFHKTVPDTCGMCHTDVAEQFKASVHGRAVAKGIAAAPVCTNCHGEHSILAPKDEASTVNAGHIRETCGQCHGNLQLSKRFGLPTDRIVSFDASFHGLAAKSGSQSVANCASCHGVHNILPSSDSRAMTNPKNLPATCGKCHAGAGARFSLGPIHQLPGASEPESVKWLRIAYSFLIPVTIGFMLLHNMGDWVRKLAARRFAAEEAAARLRAAAHEPESGDHGSRMLPFERVQHAVMALSFIVLVWTGFALKYPSQWWARPLVHWEVYFPVRGTVHRVASVVLLAIGAVHVISLIVNKRLRVHWMEMLPRRSDVSEAVQNFAYNMGLIRQKPYRSPHSYIEKAEYWAVIWGTAVMAASGIVLWANNLTLRFLPKSAIDFATALHLYEAVLATLAIVVWHFYSVIFDPDVYPLETAFLTGRSVKDARKWQKPTKDLSVPELVKQDRSQ